MESKEFLLRLRKEKGLSQAELAEELGITRQTISRWEAGVSTPSAENLISLSRVYGMTVEEMMRNRTEQTGETEPPAEEGSQKEAANERADQPQGRSRKWLWGIILTVGLLGGVLLYGELTNSMLLAGGLLVLVMFLAVLVCLLYGLFIVITHFRKDG